MRIYVRGFLAQLRQCGPIAATSANAPQTGGEERSGDDRVIGGPTGARRDPSGVRDWDD